MSIKRIVGRTVGTPISTDKLKEELKGMESAESMGIVARIQDSDYLIIHDLPEKTMAKITWKNIASAITSKLERKIFSEGIIDPESGYSATVPELEDDAVIALASDITDALKSYYTSAEVDARISAIPKFSIEVVSTLPTENISATTVYLVISNPGDTSGQLYTEYIYVGGRWEKLGEQTVDLSGYVTTEELMGAVEAALTEAKESGMFDGRGISHAYVNPSGNLMITYVVGGKPPSEVSVGRVVGRGISSMYITEEDGELMVDYDDGDGVNLGRVVGRGIEDVWVEDGNLKLTYVGIDEIFDLGRVEGRGISRAYIDDDGNLWLEYTDGESEMLDHVVGRGVERMYVDDNGDLYVSYTETPDERSYVGHVKGDPYTLTDADKAEMVDLVLNALPTWNGGSY